MEGQGLERLKSIIPIMLGTAIYAFGLHYFVISNELMEGGITGIALILHYVLHIPPSYSTLAINIPLFYIGLKVFGKEAMLYSIIGTLSLSFFLWLMELLIARGWIVPFQSRQDYFLATAYAGVTIGIGLGLVFRYGGTTGGSDIIARIGQKYKGWSMGQMILMFDIAVIGSSLFFIPKEKVLYTFVAVFIASKTIDLIIEGAYSAKAFTIITDNAEKLARVIMQQLDRGATIMPAIGAYSGKHKHIVYCVVYRYEMKLLKDLVRTNDPAAFIIIGEVQDVLGEGFKND
ncbi:YitT family protein [Paenibacillus thalictri]|uniref:YitT family protein n=1 Tax=Paenibacillus thalictri TaxID=2527873 RepID=A0A4Q9DVL1_9BACL|nr:YitT family protein [Paenibacillus thalictri]TBL79718.1 YitT family protein [Paenibacillus thalictri]